MMDGRVMVVDRIEWKRRPQKFDPRWIELVAGYLAAMSCRWMQYFFMLFWICGICFT